MNNVSRSPWARSWMVEQQEKGLPRDWYGQGLLALIVIALVALVAAQVGLKLGREEGIQLGEAQAFQRHYEQYSKVQWLMDEANLRAMYERR